MGKERRQCWIPFTQSKMIGPPLGIAAQVHHGNYQNLIWPALIDNPKGKPVSEATAGATGKHTPSFGSGQNSEKRCLYFV